MKRLRVIFLFSMIILQLSCSKNAFLESAKKDTDAAITYEVRKLLDSQDYSGAITALGTLSTTAQAGRDIQALFASAYAGRCGLNLIGLANTLSTSSSAVMVSLLSIMQSSSASMMADCITAEGYLKTISATAAGRTTEENLLMAFIGMAKIGAVLAVYADTDNNGVSDATFDPCNVAKLPDAYAREIATGFTLLYTSIKAANASVLSSLVTSLDNFCGTGKPLNSLCNTVVAASFSATDIKAMNGLVKSVQFGVGTCNDSTLVTCVCP